MVTRIAWDHRPALPQANTHWHITPIVTALHSTIHSSLSATRWSAGPLTPVTKARHRYSTTQRLQDIQPQQAQAKGPPRLIHLFFLYLI